MPSNKLLIICGPTATGKTNLGIKLAQQFNGEIVSADSRQVYRGMDVGTGKSISNLKPQTSNLHWGHQQLTYYQQSGMKLWGYDLVNPDQEFSLAHFQQFISVIIPDIHSRGKLPIVVGGTGLYLKSLSQNLETTTIPRNKKLRVKLKTQSLSNLQNQLKTFNPQKFTSMNHSDKNNPRRLIRAIEIQTYYQQASPSSHKTHRLSIDTNQLWVGLAGPLSLLEQRVTTNVETRSQNISQEMKSLLSKYPEFWSFPSSTATGYQQWHQHLEDKISSKQAIELWTIAETQYLRRQLTWFKKQPQINWFDISLPDIQSQVAALVKPWYSNSNNRKNI